MFKTARRRGGRFRGVSRRCATGYFADLMAAARLCGAYGRDTVALASGSRVEVSA